MNESALRVFIADDEPLARERLRTLLDDLQPECPSRVVGEASGYRKLGGNDTIT